MSTIPRVTSLLSGALVVEKRRQPGNSKPRPSSDSPSRWIWPFELKERLGEGGMGVVYRARYVVNDREVAVKILPDDVKNPIVLARFERELEVLKNLKHPNIVRSFGGVCEDKHRFYAMELVEGGSLEDYLQERGKLPWEQVIEYGQQMCAALAYLHQHGVVHRDIKPANFLIAKDKRLKLSDFGLASVIAARRITTAGKTAGTILYMAPEQIRGGHVTPQTDLYALGCVLYELLAGTPPYVGSTAAATMNMHCHDPLPRVTKAALDCPVALELLIQTLLAKDAKDRPPDAAHVARELAKVTQTVAVVTRQRAIDSDQFRLGAPTPTECHETSYKETRDISRRAALRRWPVIVLIVAVAVVTAWVGSLHQANEAVRRSEALWIEASRSPDRTIRLHALTSLGRLRAVSAESREAVVQNLSAEDPEFRAAAAAALGEIGAPARTYVGELHKLRSSDPNDEVRNQARNALARIQQDRSGDGPGSMAVLSGLVLIAAAAIVFNRRRLSGLIEASSVPRKSAGTAPRP